MKTDKHNIIMQQVTQFLANAIIWIDDDISAFKIKVIRFQPPKKLDIILNNPIFKGTRIKIRNVEIDSEYKVTYRAEIQLHFFDIHYDLLTESQKKLADELTHKITQSLIKTYYLSKQ